MHKPPPPPPPPAPASKVTTAACSLITSTPQPHHPRVLRTRSKAIDVLQVIEADVCTDGPGEGYIGRFAVKQAHKGCTGTILRELLAISHIHSCHPGGHPHVVAPKAVVIRPESRPDTPGTADYPNRISTSHVAAIALEVFAGDLGKPCRPMRTARRWRVLSQCIDALLAAQAAGVAHGDLKSANVFVRDDGSIAVGDWASARFPARHDTTTDAPSGSPVFMSPEAWVSFCSRERGSPQPYRVFPADVWSLGVIAMQLALPERWAAVIEQDPAVKAEVRQRAGLPRGIARMHAAVRRTCEPCTVMFVGRALDAVPERRAGLAELARIANAGYVAACVEVARAADVAAAERAAAAAPAAAACPAADLRAVPKALATGVPSCAERLKRADARETGDAVRAMQACPPGKVSAADAAEGCLKRGPPGVTACLDHSCAMHSCTASHQQCGVCIRHRLGYV